MSRGRAGNSGGSDLIFAKEKGKESINAIRNAKLDNCIIDIGDSLSISKHINSILLEKGMTKKFFALKFIELNPTLKSTGESH